MSESKPILDSGERREFETGAVRDIQGGKGLPSLMPLDIVAKVLDKKNFVTGISLFMRDGLPEILCAAIHSFVLEGAFPDVETALLEASIHFEQGAAKYGVNNWRKGIPVSCYIDSIMRHYLKWRRGDEDERHDRAVVWNILCCAWTVKHKPECNDLGIEDEMLKA